MTPWLHAWVLATFSGVSLPIGAILGIVFTPVHDEVCAGWMALGAGALLFAVTVELYGHSLRELEAGRAGILELLATVVGALVGAIFYLAVNRWLEHTMEEEFEDNESLGPTERSPIRGSRRTAQSVGSALAEERHLLEKTPHVKDSGASAVSFSMSRQNSLKSLGSESPSIQARGRDRVINRMASSHYLEDSAASVQQVDPELARKGKKVAFALFVGILVDGVPEGVLMGFLAAEGHLSAVFVISLLVANFPEAFSSASLMRQADVAVHRIVGMWGGLCLGVGMLAGAACFLLQHFFPDYPNGQNMPQALLVSIAIIEGITGGAMIACIATVMLPEAFLRAGKVGSLYASSGFLCTAGFLIAVVMKALEHHYNNTHGQPGQPGLHGHAFNALGFLL